MENKYDLTWEQSVFEMQNLPEFKDFIYDSYLTMDLEDNCVRYFNSSEFKAIQSIINLKNISTKKILILNAGNGITSYSFSKIGFYVFALEESESRVVGRGAIEIIKNNNNLNIEIKKGVGEKIPFSDNFFDIVYERQSLNNTYDMEKTLSEIHRVLKPGGILLATREHVVANYRGSLKKFYRINPVHRVYGRQKAFKYSYYKKSINKAGLNLLYSIKPYESEINLTEKSFAVLKNNILNCIGSKILKLFLNKDTVYKIGLKILKMKKTPGLFYSFIAKK